MSRIHDLFCNRKWSAVQFTVQGRDVPSLPLQQHGRVGLQRVGEAHGWSHDTVLAIVCAAQIDNKYLLYM